MTKYQESGGEAGRLAADDKLIQHYVSMDEGSKNLQEDIKNRRIELPDGTKIKMDVREYRGQILTIIGVDDRGKMRLKKENGVEFDSVYSIMSPAITKVE